MKSSRKKFILFNYYQRDQIEAGLKVNSKGLLCPLCWKVISYEELSIEHVIPASVGGRDEILTCRACNNAHGTALDAHLTAFQRTHDAFKGAGIIPAMLSVNGNSVRSDFEIQSRQFKIIRKTSNPSSSKQIQNDLASGDVSEITATLQFGYSENRYRTAVLRAAYLILFKHMGYRYLMVDSVGKLRSRINDSSRDFPRIASLMPNLADFQPPVDEAYIDVPLEFEGVRVHLVVVRSRIKTVSYHGIFLPGNNDPRFFEVMERRSQIPGDQRLTGRYFVPIRRGRTK